MKKVVICVPSLGTGGAERFAVDLALNLDKKKYDVIIAETRVHVDGIFKNMLLESGIRVENLAGNNYITMLRKQLLFLKREKPDVIHANTGSVLHMMFSCWIKKVPTKIYTVHNEAKLLYGDNILKKIMYKFAFSIFGFIPVAICPTVKKTIEESLNIKAEKIPLVKNGVDIKKFFPSSYEKKQKPIKIISVGSLYWIKNQAMIIEAVDSIRKKGVDLELVLLGEGEERKNLEELVKHLNAEGYVFMPGIKRNVKEYLSESDIYLSASRTEGLPLSILEAMACGLPIVSTCAGGVQDIVFNNQNGYVVDIEDKKGYENALLELCCNIRKRKLFAKKSREIAETWSLERCVNGYSKLYNNE